MENPATSPLVWLVLILSLFQIVHLQREARKAARRRDLPRGPSGEVGGTAVSPSGSRSEDRAPWLTAAEP
jgi:hypothetical protein